MLTIFFQDRYHASSLAQPPPMIQSQQSSPGALSGGNMQPSQSNMQQHSPVAHPVVPQQTYNMLSPVPSVPGSHSTSPNHQMYNRVKTEPKSGGNNGTSTAEIPMSDAMSNRMWKREVLPPDGYYSAGIWILNFNDFQNLPSFST